MSTPKLPSEMRLHEGHSTSKHIGSSLEENPYLKNGDKDFWYWICLGMPGTWGSKAVWFWAVDPIKTGGNDE